MTFEDYDPYGEGYALDDPKHSSWSDNVLAAAEALKEQRWEPLDAGADYADSWGVDAGITADPEATE